MYSKQLILIPILIILFSCKTKEIVSEKPKNIIFIVGDGMGISQITAGMYANNHHLSFLERCKIVGLIKTHSKKELITDSAAGATAFATGKKTRNGMISMAMKDSSDYKTFIEYAEENNKATGLVGTCSVTHATPACFYAHFPRRYDANQAIAVQFMNHDIDVLIGGGKAHFETREDGRNLIQELKDRNYVIVDSLTADFDTKNITKLINLYSPKHPGIIKELKPDSVSVRYKWDEPMPLRGNVLPLGTEKALEILSKDENGFFMMIEGSQIDWEGHNNSSQGIINEMKDFDNAVKIALDFAEKDGNTLVVITADHETGGYAIIDGKLSGDSLVGAFTTLHHTADMVPVFAFGKGAEAFGGVYDNTEIFHKMMRAFSIQEK